MKPHIILAFGILLLPLVSAAVLLEDFEDDTLGAAPTGDYSFSNDATGPGGCQFLANVQNDGTSQALRLFHDSGVITPPSGSCTDSSAWFRIDWGNAGQVQGFSFDVKCDAGRADQFWTLQAANGAAIDGAQFFDIGCLRGVANDNTYHSVVYLFDWGAKTYDYYVNDVLVLDDQAFNNGGADEFGQIYAYTGGQQGDSNTKIMFYDNLQVGELFPVPLAPAGLYSVATQDGVLVQFPLSANETGGYTYVLEADLGGGYAPIQNFTQADAEDGSIEFVHELYAGNVSYQVFAREVVDGVPSCATFINASAPGDEDGCGTLSATNRTDLGSWFGQDGFFYGNNKAKLAENAKLTEEGLDMVYGTLLIGILVLGGARAAGGVGALIAGVAGFVAALAFQLYPLWVLPFMLAAVGGLGVLRVIRHRDIGGV